MKLWFLFLFTIILFYGHSLRYGFSQDDWYFLLISQASSLKEVVQFFSPWHQQGFAFFRPLGTQLYYFLFVASAGLENAPYLMHVFMLLIHTTSAYLAFSLLHKITKDRVLSVWIGVLYASSSAHFLSLFYIAATQQLLSAMLGLLVLNALLDRRPRVAALWMIPALLSKESAIVVPVIAALILQLQYRYGIKKIAWRLAPTAAIITIYLLVRMAAGIVVQSEYHPDFSLKLVSTLRWYYFFGYGAPEELMHYASPGLFINFWRYIRDLGPLAIISTFTTIVLTLTGMVVMLCSLIAGTGISRRHLILYILWWLTGIGLIMWYPDHRYPHYLDLALIPMLLILTQSVKGGWRVLIGVLFLASSWAAINISEDHHWTTKRAVEARSQTAFILESGSCAAPNGVVFEGALNDMQEISYALSLANGPRVICDNPTLPVYYEGLYP